MKAKLINHSLGLQTSCLTAVHLNLLISYSLICVMFLCIGLRKSIELPWCWWGELCTCCFWWLWPCFEDMGSSKTRWTNRTNYTIKNLFSVCPSFWIRLGRPISAGTLAPIFQFSSHSSWITACKWHTRSWFHLLSASYDGKVMLWDLRTAVQSYRCTSLFDDILVLQILAIC